MFLWQQPSEHTIARFLEASRALPLSYAPVGLSTGNPEGFSVDQVEVVIGRGADGFARARQALQDWAHFDLGWVRLAPARAPVRIGTVVAVVVQHLGFWSLNGCRIVRLVEGDREREFGFAYGTLENHAEMGEEVFHVIWDPASDEVRYRIRAVSRPGSLLTWCGYPISRRIQARFRLDSGRAMQRAVARPR